MSAPPPVVVAVVPVRRDADGSLELGAGDREAVAEALAIDPAARCVIVSGADGFAPGAWSAALMPYVEAAAIVLFPASPDGRDLAPRVAADLDRALYAGALSVTSSHVTVAAAGGRAQDIVAIEGPMVATLQQGVRSPQGDVGWPESVQVEVSPSSGRRDARLVEELPADVATMDLGDADRIVGGGAGLMGADDPAEMFELLNEFGSSIGASMGATRVVTDAGWVGHQRQIGTTGVVVDPGLYLAFGISGAVQHTAGLGRPAHIISVNTDPHCPMMAMADLAVVADAQATLRELQAALRRLIPEPAHG